jgi:hypothetical protein
MNCVGFYAQKIRNFQWERKRNSFHSFICSIRVENLYSRKAFLKTLATPRKHPLLDYFIMPSQIQMLKRRTNARNQTRLAAEQVSEDIPDLPFRHPRALERRSSLHHAGFFQRACL